MSGGGPVSVTATAGSVLDGNGAAVNVAAGAATLQAAGVIGTLADPLEIAVGGLADTNANGAQAGVSVDINGTTGDNTLHFALTVPGQIFFNGVLLHSPAPPTPPSAQALEQFSLPVYQQGIASCRSGPVPGDLGVRLPGLCGVRAPAREALPSELPVPVPDR